MFAVLASLNDASFSQEKHELVIPVTISSQNGHIPCSALLDMDDSVTLLGEKLQCQLNFSVKPHYKLVVATGDFLTTLETAHVDIVWDHETWLTQAIVLSALKHPLILGINFLKLTKLKITSRGIKSKLNLKHFCQIFMSKTS